MCRYVPFALRGSSFVILLHLCAASVSAATYDVGVGQDYATITAALTAAGDGVGDVINVVDPNHTEPNIVVDKSVTIQGQGMTTTAVQAHAEPESAGERVFDILADKTVTIRDMTIRHGDLHVPDAEALGGGIKNGGTLTLTRVRVTANRVYSYNSVGPYAPDLGNGGGIYNQGTLTIEDSEVVGNEARGLEPKGGGIYSDGTATLVRCLVSDNAVLPGYDDARGGGIYSSGELTILDSTISDNTVKGSTHPNTPKQPEAPAWGGGVYSSGVMNVTRSKLTGNTAEGNAGLGLRGCDGWGGAICNAGTATIVDCTLDDNAAIGGNGEAGQGGALGSPANGYGGGIANLLDAECVIQSSTLSNNQAVPGAAGIGAMGVGCGGGAVDSQSDANSTETMTFINSTISGNMASLGGGVYGHRGVSLVCTTVANNWADFGGGVCSDGSEYRLDGPILAGSIVGDNACSWAGSDLYGSVQSQGYNLVEDANGCTIVDSGGENTDEGNIVGQDPHLGPLADNGGPTKTHALLGNSPALDQIPLGKAGLGTDPLDEDQRAVARPQGALCDIGAFELAVVEDGPASACCGTSAAAAMPFVGMVLLMLGRPSRRRDRRRTD